MKRRFDEWIDDSGSRSGWRGSVLHGLSLASHLYHSGIRLRTWAYRRGVFRQFTLKVPVISVGNLTVGGTGKTPLVMTLAERLRDAGSRVVVVSRGYMRQGRGVLVVTDGDRLLARRHRAGDEPYLMGLRLTGIPIIVGANRLEAGMIAAQRFEPDVIIVDDGFQHLRLHRDWDVVAVDAANPFGNGLLLPRGVLREPSAHLRRADIVCLTNSANVADLNDVRDQIFQVAPGCAIVEARHAVRSVYRHLDRADVALSALKGMPVMALSGIGNPAGFERTIAGLGAELVLSQRFGDHHRYTRKTLDEVVESARRAGADAIVTTEKDMVRFPAGFAFGMAVLVVAIELEITGGSEHIDNMVDGIEELASRRTHL